MSNDEDNIINELDGHEEINERKSIKRICEESDVEFFHCKGPREDQNLRFFFDPVFSRFKEICQTLKIQYTDNDDLLNILKKLRECFKNKYIKNRITVIIEMKQRCNRTNMENQKALLYDVQATIDEIRKELDDIVVELIGLNYHIDMKNSGIPTRSFRPQNSIYYWVVQTGGLITMLIVYYWITKEFPTKDDLNKHDLDSFIKKMKRDGLYPEGSLCYLLDQLHERRNELVHAVKEEDEDEYGNKFYEISNILKNILKEASDKYNIDPKELKECKSMITEHIQKIIDYHNEVARLENQ